MPRRVSALWGRSGGLDASGMVMAPNAATALVRHGKKEERTRHFLRLLSCSRKFVSLYLQLDR